MVWIPSIEYIRVLYDDQIHVGKLMNIQGLTSTLDKVKWGIPFQDSPTIWDQVAIMYKEIIDNHYFSDGNKRIGSLIAYIFLYKNGFKFSPAQGEIFKVTMEVAQGIKDFEETKTWFKNNSNAL